MHHAVKLGGAETGKAAIEEELAINVDLFCTCVGGEWVHIPENEVGIFAGIDGAHTVVYADDPGGIDRVGSKLNVGGSGKSNGGCRYELAPRMSF